MKKNKTQNLAFKGVDTFPSNKKQILLSFAANPLFLEFKYQDLLKILQWF